MVILELEFLAACNVLPSEIAMMCEVAVGLSCSVVWWAFDEVALSRGLPFYLRAARKCGSLDVDLRCIVVDVVGDHR